MNILRISLWSLNDYKLKEGEFSSSFEHFLLKKFIEKGNNIHYIIPNKSCTKTILYGGIDVHEFKYLDKIRLISYLSFMLSAFIMSIQVSKRYKPDVVMGCTYAGVPVAYLISKIYHIPNISRLYGTFLYENMKKQDLWALRNFEELIAFKTPCKKMIITNDGTGGNIVARALKIPKDRVKYWINGVNIKRWVYSNSNSVKSIILCVSRLERWKGVHRLIEALPTIVSERKDVEVMIIGDGSERENLKKLCKDLNVEQHVSFLGAKKHEDVDWYYAFSDIFVSLADYSNVGSQLLEALYSGCCIVTLNTGMTHDFIMNQYNGVLLEPDLYSSKLCADTILNLLAYVDVRNKLKKHALEYAKEHITGWDERAMKEVELLNECVR